ncbi:MAG: LacI family DNA-binding transcriptional regulator [Planctomycetota bacterium]
MEHSSPRLIDIAERANVSLTSVSRILGGKRLSEYPPATRERIHKIAAEMGWRPNLLVKGIQTGKTQTIGTFMAPYDTYWTGIIYGVHDQLLESKQVPLVLWPHALVHQAVDRVTNEAWATGEGDQPDSNPFAETRQAPRPNTTSSRRRELERINCFEDRRVDAIISWPLHETDAKERLAMLGARGTRVVTIDDQLPEEAGAIFVGSDNQTAMQEVVDYLRGHEHQRIGYIGIEDRHHWVELRRSAFLKAMGPASPPTCELTTHDDRCCVEIADFLKRHPELTAIVTATDHLARYTVSELVKLGRRVPQDVSIVGYGNDVFSMGSLQLTTVDQGAYEIGKLASRVAISQENPQERYNTETRLVVRDTTGRAPS